MATNTNPLPSLSDVDESPDRELTREEWWTLMNSLFGSAKEMYAEVGGAEAFIREERAAWDDKDEYR